MSLAILGDAMILDRSKLALFCSVKRPGKLVLIVMSNQKS